MSRSMLVSVGVLVVLGVIVAVSILNHDDAGPQVGSADGSTLSVPEPGGRSARSRDADSAVPEGQEPGGLREDRSDGASGAGAESTARTPDGGPEQVHAAGVARAALDSCRERIDRGEIGPALRELGHTYRASDDPTAREVWREPLLAWSAQHLRVPSDRSGMFDRYRVQPGDSLTKVASIQATRCKIRLEHGFLSLLNRIDSPRSIRPGQWIWLPNVPVSAVVALRERRLDVFLGDCLIASYRVGVGGDDKTPVAEFTVGEKIWHPTWYFSGQEIPYGDPRNELGEAWIGLEHEELKRFGIHGTNNEATVGKAVSRGCVRLTNADVTELFQVMPKGAPVTIRP